MAEDVESRDDLNAMLATLRRTYHELPPFEEMEKLAVSSCDSVRLALSSRGTPFGRGDYLVLAGQTEEGICIPVAGLPVTVGSGRRGMGGERAQVVVHSKGVSRLHCTFCKEGPFVRVCDSGSKNGTYVNGVPSESEMLCEGDRIHIGEAEFTVIRG